MNEKSLAGRPERFPYLVVIDGKVVETVSDSIAAARWWARSLNVVRLEELERVDIVDADSALAVFGVPGVQRAYVFATCRPRQAPQPTA